MLFLLFVIVPIVELYLLLAVGSRIGLIPTLATVIITAAVGSRCVRQQGLSILMQLRQQLQTGVLPGRAVVEGVLIAVSGILLVTPGFLTDATGVFLLVPASRQALASYLVKRYAGRVQTFHNPSEMHTHRYTNDYHRVSPRAADVEIIDSSDEDH